MSEAAREREWQRTHPKGVVTAAEAAEMTAALLALKARLERERLAIEDSSERFGAVDLERLTRS